MLTSKAMLNTPSPKIVSQRGNSAPSPNPTARGAQPLPFQDASRKQNTYLELRDGVAWQRRSAIALLSCAVATTLSPTLPAAASPSSAPPALTQSYTSSEGFQLSYPSNWVVAFDRSGGRATGAVVSIGDFTRFIVVSVFRTVEVPEAVRAKGLDEAAGRALCLESQAALESTMRFEQLRSEIGQHGAYDFEYTIETCRGEIQEGVGGVLRCLVSTKRKADLLYGLQESRFEMGGALCHVDSY